MQGQPAGVSIIQLFCITATLESGIPLPADRRHVALLPPSLQSYQRGWQRCLARAKSEPRAVTPLVAIGWAGRWVVGWRCRWVISPRVLSPRAVTPLVGGWLGGCWSMVVAPWTRHRGRWWVGCEAARSRHSGLSRPWWRAVWSVVGRRPLPRGPLAAGGEVVAGGCCCRSLARRPWRCGMTRR